MLHVTIRITELIDGTAEMRAYEKMTRLHRGNAKSCKCIGCADRDEDVELWCVDEALATELAETMSPEYLTIFH